MKVIGTDKISLTAGPAKVKGVCYIDVKWNSVFHCTQWYSEPVWSVLFIHQCHWVLQDRGHCGCVPGSEGTPHPKARQCAHCGKYKWPVRSWSAWITCRPAGQFHPTVQAATVHIVFRQHKAGSNYFANLSYNQYCLFCIQFMTVGLTSQLLSFTAGTVSFHIWSDAVVPWVIQHLLKFQVTFLKSQDIELGRLPSC